MITRVVKMCFRPEALNSFYTLFDRISPHIRAFPGCNEVKLLVSCEDPQILFTISKWDNLESLENYRQSELFKSTWVKTKALFDQKAKAWSLSEYKSSPS